MRNRDKWKILCIMTVFCAAAVIGCGTKTVKDSDAVMEIAGQAVVKAEYQMILAAHETEVERQYDTDTVNRKDFWTTKQEEGTPLQQVMQLAEEDLRKKKAMAKLAKEHGIAAETDYLSIVRQMEGENGRREKGEETGPVYGLASFGIVNYYDYIYTQIEHELMEKLKQEQTVSEDDLKTLYQENRELYTSDVSVKMLVAEVPAEIGREQVVRAAEALEEETDMDVLAGLCPEVSFYEIGMSSQNMGEGKSGAYMQRWLTASAMQQGEVCEPFEIGENLMAMRCLERTEHAVQPFEEIRGILESDARTQLAQEKVAGEAEQAEIHYEEEMLQQAALETLQK